MLDERSLSRVQRALAAAGLDGWLIYDFRGLNPVAKTMLGIEGMATRRVFGFIRDHARDRAGTVASLARRVGQGSVQLLAVARVIPRRTGARKACGDGVFAR